MSEANQNNPQETTPAEGNAGQQNTTGQNPTAEKKYSEDEMNGISKKNSEKAVNKLLKELGITDKEKAKQILQKAAQEEATQNTSTGNENVAEQLQSQLAAERAEKERALLESVLYTEKVTPAKIAKAVKLIELEDCRNEDGVFDRAKASEAVKALLKDWPELAMKEDQTNVGFVIGSDGQQNANGGNPAKKTKTTPQKSWNRFN